MDLFKPDFCLILRPGAANRSTRRCTHVLYLQVLDHDQRVVFAEGRGGLVQVILTNISDLAVEFCYLAICFLPVAAELRFVTHLALDYGQTSLLLLETIDGFKHRSIGQGGELRYSNIHPNHRDRGVNRLFDLLLGLDGCMPLPGRAGNRDVLWGSENTAAVSIPHPSQLGQEDAVVGLVDLKALREPKTVG